MKYSTYINLFNSGNRWRGSHHHCLILRSGSKIEQQRFFWGTRWRLLSCKQKARACCVSRVTSLQKCSEPVGGTQGWVGVWRMIRKVTSINCPWPSGRDCLCKESKIMSYVTKSWRRSPTSQLLTMYTEPEQSVPFHYRCPSGLTLLCHLGDCEALRCDR